MGKALAVIFCFLPTIYEIIDDRNGETKKDKVRDFFIAAILYAVIALVNWWMFETLPLRSLALTFAIRLAFFDYVIAYVLIRRGVIVGKWWNYRGKTARWDQLISKVDWRLLMAARAAVLASSLLPMLL